MITTPHSLLVFIHAFLVFIHAHFPSVFEKEDHKTDTA